MATVEVVPPENAVYVRGIIAAEDLGDSLLHRPVFVKASATDYGQPATAAPKDELNDGLMLTSNPTGDDKFLGIAYADHQDPLDLPHLKNTKGEMHYAVAVVVSGAVTIIDSAFTDPTHISPGMFVAIKNVAEKTGSIQIQSKRDDTVIGMILEIGRRDDARVLML